MNLPANHPFPDTHPARPGTPPGPSGLPGSFQTPPTGRCSPPIDLPGGIP